MDQRDADRVEYGKTIERFGNAIKGHSTKIVEYATDAYDMITEWVESAFYFEAYAVGVEALNATIDVLDKVDDGYYFDYYGDVDDANDAIERAFTDAAYIVVEKLPDIASCSSDHTLCLVCARG